MKEVFWEQKPIPRKAGRPPEWTKTDNFVAFWGLYTAPIGIPLFGHFNMNTSKFLIVISLALSAVSCSTIPDQKLPFKSVWAGISSHTYNFNGPDRTKADEFIHELSRIASLKFDNLKVVPLPSTRVTAMVSFDSSHHIQIVKVIDSPSYIVTGDIETSIEETYSKIALSEEEYSNFSKIEGIFFVF